MSQEDAMFHLRGLGPVSPTLGNLEDGLSRLLALS